MMTNRLFIYQQDKDIYNLFLISKEMSKYFHIISIFIV